VGEFCVRVSRRQRAALALTIEAFHFHAWSGKLFLGLTGIGLAGSIGGFVFGVLSELLFGLPGGSILEHLPVTISIGGVIPGALLQWWFLTSLARFRPTARAITVVMCTFAVIGSLVGLFSGHSPAAFVTSLAGFGMSLQFLLYFRSDDYEERASAYREMMDARKREPE
jgi:hypothetical protein